MKDETPRVYWNPEPIPREWAEAALDSGDPDAIVNALIRLTYNEGDWRWVFGQCERFLDHPVANVRRNVAICFELLARFHEEPDTRSAIPLLERLSHDPETEVSAEAHDAIQGILTVLRPKGIEE